jgi:hypothetical protein
LVAGAGAATAAAPSATVREPILSRSCLCDGRFEEDVCTDDAEVDADDDDIDTATAGTSMATGGPTVKPLAPKTKAATRHKRVGVRTVIIDYLFVFVRLFESTAVECFGRRLRKCPVCQYLSNSIRVFF